MDYCDNVPVTRKSLSQMQRKVRELCRISGGAYSVGENAPDSPEVGDYWYRSDLDRLYKRIDDGTSTFWKQISN